MSGIGGILSLDGHPVDRDILERMRDIIDFRGPDGNGLWISERGNVGFIHRLLWNTEESIYEKQPMTNGRGLWITADCRIDNRDELRREFQAREIWHRYAPVLGLEPHQYPDVVYILMAYEIWGEDTPNHLLGDFSFALWDEHNQKLFCARDQIGLKPFVYHWGGEKLIFGSEMKQVFQDDSISHRLHLPHLADLLTANFPNREETPYEAIRRLPPAHAITVQGQRFNIRRYWNWLPDSEPKSQNSLEENAEIFLSLFTKSVEARRRVPPSHRVGSLLSGGLDSSSIVSVAATIQTQRLTGKFSHFPVFTLHFPEADPSYQLKHKDPVDESFYSSTVILKYNLEEHRVEIKGQSPFQDLKEHLWFQETPLPFPNLVPFQSLFYEARNSGVRVLFHGEGGDELFYIGPRCCLEDLKQGHLVELFKAWLLKHRKKGTSYHDLCGSLFFILRNLLPEWLGSPHRHSVQQAVPGWVNPHFAKAIDLEKRVKRDFFWKPRLRSSSSYGTLNWLLRGAIPGYLEALNRMSASASLDLRLPFLDLRLLQFSASLPWRQKMNGGVTKVILRAALQNLLPPQIQNRLRKTEFTPAVRANLERYTSHLMEELFSRPHPTLLTMILPDKVSQLVKGYFSQKYPADSFSLWHIWYLMSLDQWLKNRSSLRKNLTEVSCEKSAKEIQFASNKV